MKKACGKLLASFDELLPLSFVKLRELNDASWGYRKSEVGGEDRICHIHLAIFCLLIVVDPAAWSSFHIPQEDWGHLQPSFKLVG